MAELTISASLFKARCLDLMDQIASRKLSRVTITKRGRPVSVLSAAAPETARRSMIGSMAYRMPGMTDADWAAVDAELVELRGAWSDSETMQRAMDAQLRREA